MMEQHNIAEVKVAGGHSSLIQHPSIHISKDATKPREEERWGPVGRSPTPHCSDGWRLLESSHKVHHQLWLWASFSLFRWWKFTYFQCTAWKRWWMCCQGVVKVSPDWILQANLCYLNPGMTGVNHWPQTAQPGPPLWSLFSSMSQKMYDFVELASWDRRSAANQPIFTTKPQDCETHRSACHYLYRHTHWNIQSRHEQAHTSWLVELPILFPFDWALYKRCWMEQVLGCCQWEGQSCHVCVSNRLCVSTNLHYIAKRIRPFRWN